MSEKRVVVKLGSSSLTDAGGRLSDGKMRDLAGQIVRAQAQGQCRVVLVSSGAVAAGMERLGWQRASSTVPERQAAAAVGQGLLIHRYQQIFEAHGVPMAQLLLTRQDVEDRRRFVHIRNTMETLLRHGILPIVNENDTVAVDELRFGDNDTLAALTALVADAKLLVLLTDIDGLYTANPRRDPSATRIARVASVTVDIERLAEGSGSAVGTGGMRTKLRAAKIATESGIDVVVARSTDLDVLAGAVRGDPVGTLFQAQSGSRRAKRSWMAHGSRADGGVVMDQGAARAVSQHSGSLLFPGVVEVRGDFSEGAVVDLLDPDEKAIGRGVVNFSAADLRLLLERRRARGPESRLQEVVHRNAMVVFHPVRGRGATRGPDETAAANESEEGGGGR